MSGWDYDQVGRFGSARDATDWARRNGIDPRDLDIRGGSGGVDVAVRRSATGGGRFRDADNGRRDGFF